MDFKSVSVNNCYILRDEIFDNRFFTYINSKAVYSASIFHLAFFKGNINLLSKEVIKEYEQLIIKLYRLNSPYLYIPFEINIHEDKLYQSYYESDHFPLSVWLEEKKLIPFEIFIRIMEDILFALHTLAKNGISHLFLTPEEILLPLQWTKSNHVKLYNVGINLLISALMNDTEINNYRKIYYSNKITDKLNFKISDDIYSFGKIMEHLASFCNFIDDKLKNKIQDITTNILTNSNNFNSIEEVIVLFDDYFSETNRKNILGDKEIDYKYSGQAGFVIPEFNEWKEEAELELLPENIKNKSSAPQRKILKHSLLNSVSAVFIRFFSRKKKRKTVSNTLNDYTELQRVIPPETELKKTDLQKSNSSVKVDFNNNKKNILEQTKLVLNKIDEHYTSKEIKNIEKKDKVVIVDNKNTLTLKTKETITDLHPSTNQTETNFANTDNKFYLDFNKSLEERNYKRTYEIIQESIDFSPKGKRKEKEFKLKNLLDDKLKQLDNHYIKNNDATILEKIAIINKIQPMKEEKIKKDFEELLVDSKESTTLNNSNFLIKFIIYVINKVKRITK